MKTLTTTVRQMIILSVLGLVVGLGMNVVRGKNHINLWREYGFKPPVVKTNGTSPSGNGQNGATTQPKPDETGNVDEVEILDLSQLEGPTEEHPFRELTLKQVTDIFKDERTEYGAHVFVDARADGAYQAGHIPHALQCDYYRLEHYLMPMLSVVAGAEKIVVYCNGGDCEDSLYVCGELQRSDVPWDTIYLFKGGWEAWKESGMPVATGPAAE